MVICTAHGGLAWRRGGRTPGVSSPPSTVRYASLHLKCLPKSCLSPPSPSPLLPLPSAAMPSVRVKRASGYTSLHDASHDAAGTPGPSRRPRRSSVATLLTPHPDSSRTPNLDFPMHTSPTDATGSPLSRRRALSLSTAGRTDANESELRPLRRRSSSKVSNHIMSMTRTPTGPLRNISEERDPFAAAAQAAVQGEGKSRHRHGSLSRHREGEEDDMISLQGPQMELLVPKTENGPGRVGSSLSLPRSEHSDYADYDNDIDGEHHPDDIVEHLDVIGARISALPKPLALSCTQTRRSQRWLPSPTLPTPLLCTSQRMSGACMAGLMPRV